MDRNEGRAEVVLRQNFEMSGPHVFRKCRAVLRRRRYVTATLFSGIFVLGALEGRAQVQNPPAIVPNLVSIDLTQPLLEPLQYRFPGRQPKSEVLLELKGSGQDWTFVQFDKLPPNISLKTKDQPEGYNESEEIQPEKKWYWFRIKLPLVLEIKSGARPPINLSFWLGVLRNAEREQAKGMSPEQMRAFVDSHQFTKAPLTQALILTWEAPVDAAPSPVATQTSTATAEPSLWKFLTQDDPRLGLIVLLVGLSLFGLFGLLVRRNLKKRSAETRRKQRREEERRFLNQNQNPHPKHQPINQQKAVPIQTQTPLTGKPSTDPMYEGFGEPTPPLAPVVPAYQQVPGDEGKKSTSKPSRQREYEDWPQAEKVEPSPRLTKQSGPMSGQDGKKWTELEGRMNQLEVMLREKVDRQENLTPAGRANVQSMLGQFETNMRSHLETRLKQSASEAVKPIEDLMNEHSSAVKREFEKTASSITQMSGESEKVKKQLGNVLDELKQVETRLRTRLVELQTALDRRTVPDSFYARALGDVLGQHLEALQDGSFEKLMGEHLNQFFQTDVARVERLQEFRERAERLGVALKEVAVQMGKLNPQVTGEARPQMQRVEALVTDVIGLQSQLQTRRATIETTLRIPVSTHAGARQTFLDELGRGIRREIEKLKEPENYFEGELSRLITTDVISIVDICDSRIAPAPDTRPELEGVLKKLFEEAGLRQILPRRGEPFNTAVQDLTEMDKNPGPSMTVAQVMTRGFYYTHRDNETLLRKAGVTVYR
jgi:hypothetical protein